MKRTEISSARSMRRLRPDEPDPPGRPREFRSNGYVLLRWRVAPRTFVERLKRNEDGSLVRTVPYRKPPVDRQRVAALHAAGLNGVEISRQVGSHNVSVTRVLRRAGVPGRERTPVDPDRARRLYVDEGRTLQASARELGVDVQRLRRALVAVGVTIRRPGGPRGPDRYEAEFRAARPRAMARAGGRCQIRANDRCSGAATHVHHRKRRGPGGNDDANLIAACSNCHSYAHEHVAEAVAAGWIVRVDDDPETIPCRPGCA